MPERDLRHPDPAPQGPREPALQVVMLRDEQGHHAFLSGGPNAGTRPARGRLERWSRGLQSVLLKSGRGLGPTARRIRDWLNGRVDADEPLLAALRSAGRVRVVHPASLDPAHVAETWGDYVRTSQLRHVRRLAVNLVLSPLTLLLAPLPGPNLIGYWFVYRAGCHALILIGARRAALGQIPLETEPCEALDTPVSPADRARLAFAAAKHGGRGFETRFREVFGPDAGIPIVEAAEETATPAAPAMPEESRSWMWAAVPNALTVTRLVLALAFPWIAADRGFAVALVAAATEFLDGFLSRLLRVTSTFGRILDPIADKLFVLSVLGTIWHRGLLAGWMLPLVAARDLIVLGGAIWVVLWEGLTSVRRMPPSVPGKVATAAQFAFLLGTLYYGPLGAGPLAATSFLSLLAGVDYVRRFR